MELENLCHLKFRDNFWFNVDWCRRSVAAQIICMRLAESRCHANSHVYGLIMLVMSPSSFTFFQ